MKDGLDVLKMNIGRGDVVYMVPSEGSEEPVPVTVDVAFYDYDNMLFSLEGNVSGKEESVFVLSNMDFGSRWFQDEDACRLQIAKNKDVLALRDCSLGTRVYYLPDNIATAEGCLAGTVCGIRTEFDSDTGQSTMVSLTCREDASVLQDALKATGETMDTEDRIPPQQEVQVEFPVSQFGERVFVSFDTCQQVLAREKEIFHQGLQEWEQENGLDEPSGEDLERMAEQFQRDNAGFGIDFSRPVNETVVSEKEPVKAAEKPDRQHSEPSVRSVSRPLPTIDGYEAEQPDMTLE